MNDIDRIYVNEHVFININENFRTIKLYGIPILYYHKEDKVADRVAMVTLVETGVAKAKEVSEAFSVHRATIFRCQKKVAEGGIGSLADEKRGPRGGKKIKGELEKVVKRLKSKGLSNAAIAQRLGLSQTGVQKALIRIGYKAKEKIARQASLLREEGGCPDVNVKEAEKKPIEILKPKESIPDSKSELELQSDNEEGIGAVRKEPTAVEYSGDSDPRDRSIDRVLALAGLLDDAVPKFCERAEVVFAGFLLAIPALVSSGVFEVAQKVYGSIGPAFYGLRTTMLVFLMMAILRIKRPEQMKQESPESLGFLLGLDRSPEVKTLRRKLTRLAGYGKAYEFLKRLTRLRIKQQRGAIGYLYIDGFVRAYHGTRKLSKVFVSRRRLAMPGVTDYWINDKNGDPLFVVTSEANVCLTKMMIPVLNEIRNLIGKRRATVVFDRGGWSPKLFKEILSLDFDIMTYRKGKIRKIPKKEFTEHSLKIDGQSFTYHLHEKAVRFLKGKLRLRQVTRLREENRQTQILTSRWDLAPVKVVYRMFNRWRQENFFKYMSAEYALDALVDYNCETVAPDLQVPNPVRRKVAKEIREAKRELAKCEQSYGAEAFDEKECLSSSGKGFKTIRTELAEKLKECRERIIRLKQKQRSLHRQVPAKEAYNGELVRLSSERKLLTDVLKMTAYQAESALVNAIKPYYSRADEEGRKLIVAAFHDSGTLEVKDGKLVVSLDMLSSPNRTKALAALCKELNNTEVQFPGTDLLIEYRIKD